MSATRGSIHPSASGRAFSRCCYHSPRVDVTQDSIHQTRTTAAHAALAVTAVLIVILTLLSANVFWRNEAYLDDASGNWTALAKDVTEGVFYRPLHGDAGYGGSRYFPLHFVLHAGVMKAVGDPIRSGLVVSAVSVALLLAAVHVLLRRVGAPWPLSVSCAAFVLAGHPAQEALFAIKGDALAAALNLWGVALCADAALPSGALLAAAVAFTLAFATKVTAVSGLAAAAGWLFLTRRSRTALLLLLLVGVGVVLVIGLMYLGSSGVAFGVFRASASGGATWSSLVKAPLTFAKQARRVPETLAFVQLGFAALLVLLWHRAIDGLALLFFTCVLCMTVVIFGSPGTDTNHLLDLHVASIVLVGSWIARRGLPRASFSVAALVVAALAGGLSLASGLVDARSEQRRGLFADTLARIPDKSRPILAQNPLLPVVAGQRAYLLDPFLIRLLSERDPALVEPLWRELRAQKFAAVVFERDPREERARGLYRSALLGERFLDEVDRNYEIAATIGPRTVFLPRVR